MNVPRAIGRSLAFGFLVYIVLAVVWPAAYRPDPDRLAYENETAIANVLVYAEGSARTPHDVGDCLADDPTKRLNLRDVGRRRDAERALINQVRHLVLRVRSEGGGSRVTVHARPGASLSALHRAAVDRCLA